MISELHDIDGVDPASLWPLAIGWWILIGVCFLLCAFLLYRIWVMRSWQWEALRSLKQMEKNLSESNAKETLSSLSEYLRRIVLKRYSRETCAGLIGDEWLRWLKEKDSKGFDWEKKGLVLIEIPYAPEETKIPPDQVKELIGAVKGWVN